VCILILFYIKLKSNFTDQLQDDKQWTYNVTLRRSRASIVGVGKQ
jgi:hypothetical protein